MRLPLLMLIVALLATVIVDTYIIVALRKRHVSKRIQWVYIALSVLLAVVLIVGLCLPTRGGDNDMLLTKMWLLFGIATLLVPKIIFVIIDLVASLPRLFGKRRIKAVTITGVVLACVVFLAMWWGAIFNRFSIQTRYVDIEIENLPQSFEGYRIVQISDLHVGTYGGSTRFLDKLVAKVNELKPDVIFFTGDIVNRSSYELPPYVETLSQLHAPDGVIAILGNHDYADYMDFRDEWLRLADRAKLQKMERDMGWHLLMNEHLFITRSNDSIAVVGVENVGDPPFPVYGMLEDSYPTLGDSTVKILLTHNPAHWVDEIADNDNLKIDLTLSGHTHAMQIELFGISPAALRYPTWGGLYRDKSGKHPLYVNTGTGTVGMPMRLGATPEVTVITLHSK
ncbi:MAG: metallophosphoesterase [Bacteroides sp.]|nr:metallophosphoesterase [Bacteroides sp.]MCM1413140.1 metallophosphoesterase [Bacteroides sp.]MCM1472118.1 metallophosphoesterase [Bacteroides sp.]